MAGLQLRVAFAKGQGLRGLDEAEGAFGIDLEIHVFPLPRADDPPPAKRRGPVETSLPDRMVRGTPAPRGPPMFTM